MNFLLRQKVAAPYFDGTVNNLQLMKYGDFSPKCQKLFFAQNEKVAEYKSFRGRVRN